MSWDGYVDSVISSSSGIASEASIIGQDGSIWTPHGGNPKTMKISAEEALRLGKSMAAKNESCRDNFATNGLTLGGVKYQFLRDIEQDGRSMIFKKKDVGLISIASSEKAVVVAFTPDANNSSSSQSNKAVAHIASYLTQSGY